MWEDSCGELRFPPFGEVCSSYFSEAWSFVHLIAPSEMDDAPSGAVFPLQAGLIRMLLSSHILDKIVGWHDMAWQAGDKLGRGGLFGAWEGLRVGI